MKGDRMKITCEKSCEAKAYQIEIRQLKAKIDELEVENLELADLAIWMTGCGYDFCKHEYFCKQRDKLLKGGVSDE